MAYIDHLTATAGGPEIWLKITTTFRLNQDPGASFALADSVDAAIAMADILGFGSLAVVTKARPVIAVTAALHEIPEPARLKLANAQFGTHRCSGSPAEFPLLCSFTTEISDQAIVVSPYPAGTFTQQDAPSLSWRDRSAAHIQDCPIIG